MNRSVSEDDKMKSNYAEYIVKRKGDGKLLFRKIGIIILAAALLFGGCYVFLSVIKLPVAIVPLCLAVGVLAWYLMRFANVEYEYIVIGGTIEFYAVYGERQRKKIDEIKIADIERVVPYDTAKEYLNGITDCAEYCESMNSENLFCIILSDNGKKRAVFFNVIKKSLDAIRYYKANAVDYGNMR